MHAQQIQFLNQELTDSNRPIRLRLSGEQGAPTDRLLVKHVKGQADICGGFEYRLLCVAGRAGLPLKTFIAMAAELQFVTDRGELYSICGIVAQAAEGESDGGLATYQLVIQDALSLMETRINTRVFRQTSEIDITRTLLREWLHKNPLLARAFDFKFLTAASYPIREFTMQYNESDAAFLRRLWKRRGLAWFFEAGESTARDAIRGHRLVLFDNSHALAQSTAGTVRYHRDDGTEARDGITAWHASRLLTTGQVTRHSWDYKQSSGSEVAIPSQHDQGALGAGLHQILMSIWSTHRMRETAARTSAPWRPCACSGMSTNRNTSRRRAECATWASDSGSSSRAMPKSKRIAPKIANL